MSSDNRHFDCLKNKLPDNWVNHNATGYYNRAFWKRCKCEYGTKNPCKETCDKWNTVATEESKWNKGCTPCSNYYSKPASYYYTYNPDDCGNCGGCNKCKKSHDCGNCGNCNKCKPKPCDCDKCRPKCESKCDDDYDYCKCVKKWNVFSGNCNKCGKKCKREDCQDNRIHPLKSYVYKSGCNDCQDVAIVYRMINSEQDCDNIVELKIPVGGSKEVYLAKNFSPEFIEANRFQCATVPVYNGLDNNVIDNMREVEFTESDQSALTKRGINNYLFAKELMEDGRLIHERHGFNIPMNVCGRTSYYYFGDCATAGSTLTGLHQNDKIKAYFA